MNKYWFLTKAAFRSAQVIWLGKRIPLYAGLMITERCNLKCSYCFTDAPNRQDEEDVPLEDLKRYIDGLAKLGCLYVTIMGGEPTLRDDLDKIVDYIIEKGMMPEMSTNGARIKRWPKTIKKLFNVCNSIDGNKKAHDKNRGYGSFNTIIDSIHFCKELCVPVQLRFVATKDNTHQLSYVATTARYYGATLSVGEEWGASDTQVEYNNFWNRVKLTIAHGYPIDRSEIVIQRMIDYPNIPMRQIFKEPNPYMPTCNMRKGTVYIDHDGMMYPCVPLFKKWGKDTNKLGFKVAWDNMMEYSCVFCRSSAGDMKSSFFGGEWSTLWTILRFMRNKVGQ